MNGNSANSRILISIIIGLGLLILGLLLIFGIRQQPEQPEEQEASPVLVPEVFSKAVSARDAAACNSLDDSLQQEECNAAVEAAKLDDKGMQGCYELESQEEFRICHDVFLIKQAEEAKDPEICKQAIYSDYQEECESAAK